MLTKVRPEPAAFRRLAASYAVSRFGDFLYNTALVVVVLQRTGSAHWVALAVALRVAPYVVITPFAAVLADRVDRRRLMVATDVGRAVLMVVATVVVRHRAPVPVLLAVAALAGCVGTPFFASLTATVPDVVPAERLPGANAVISTVQYVAVVAGPASAAALLAAGRDAVPFAVNAVTFMVSAALLSGVRVPRPSVEPAVGRDSFRTAAAVGFRIVVGDRTVRPATVIQLAVAFGGGCQVVLLPLVSRDLLGTGEAGVGLLEACVGIGGVLGAGLAARLARTGRLVPLLGLAAVGCTAPTALLAVVRSPGPAYALLVGQGLASVTHAIVAMTVLQRQVPGGRLARVDGLIASLTLTAGIAGNVVGSALVDRIDLPAALLLTSATVAATISALGVAVAVRHRPG